MLPQYAALQVAMTEDVETLLALGVPDLRLATLPERYEQLLDEVGAERRFRDAVPAGGRPPRPGRGVRDR